MNLKHGGFKLVMGIGSLLHHRTLCPTPDSECCHVEKGLDCRGSKQVSPAEMAGGLTSHQVLTSETFPTTDSKPRTEFIC